MNIQDLVQIGEELRDKKWQIKLKTGKVEGKTAKEYLIDFPFNSIFDWDFESDKYINKRFGLYSAEHTKLSSIEKKSIYKQYFHLVNIMISFEPSFKTKKAASDRIKFLKARTVSYLNEKLAILQQIIHVANKKKTVYGLSDVRGAVNVLLKTKNITEGVKSKLCGNLLSQAIVIKLWNICKTESIKHNQSDEIDKLAQTIQRKSKLPRTVNYFKKNYTKFSRANRIRNQSCHAYEKPSTINDIRNLNDLYVELESF